MRPRKPLHDHSRPLSSASSRQQAAAQVAQPARGARRHVPDVPVEPTDAAAVTVLPSLATALLLSIWLSSPPLSISIHTPFRLFSASVWNSALVASASRAPGAKEQSHQCVTAEEAARNSVLIISRGTGLHLHSLGSMRWREATTDERRARRGGRRGGRAAPSRRRMTWSTRRSRRTRSQSSSRTHLREREEAKAGPAGAWSRRGKGGRGPWRRPRRWDIPLPCRGQRRSSRPMVAEAAVDDLLGSRQL